MNMLKKIHKWASVIVAIQVLIWLGSGLYFNLMDHAKAAGHSHRSHAQPSHFVPPQGLLEPKQVLLQQPASTSLELISLNSQAFYLLNHLRGLYAHFSNEFTLVDAISGEVRVIDATLATELAQLSYTGPGQVLTATLLTPPLDDFPQQQNPAWRVDYNDDVQTSVYIEAGSGRVVGHSDADKRLADLMLMLHFMDYAKEGKFNNLWMSIFATVTLLLSLTGLVWTIDLARRGQYKVKLFAKKHKVKLFDAQQRSLGQVAFYSHANILDGLVAHNIILPSTCGGGGTCGRCKIMINPEVKSTAADQLHFSATELASGYRLACQHFSGDIEHMTLMDVTAAKQISLELTSSIFISPYIKELKFKAKSKQPIQYKAGSFMRFFVPVAQGQSVPKRIPAEFIANWAGVKCRQYEHAACTRNYSLASVCNADNELMFVIKMQAAPQDNLLPGIGSNYLGNLAVGEVIEAIGPFEEFFAKPNSKNTMVLVGAGSGMAPLKALIDEHFSKASGKDHTPRHVHYFYGARTENDLIYVDYFYQLAQTNSYFHFYPVLSKPHDQWLGATGYAQQVLALNWDNIADVGQLDFYLCGPKGLMDDTFVFLDAKGVDRENIAFDVFS